MSNYWTRWDPTNKKWEYSLDGAAFTDLIEKPTLELATFNGVSAPAGIASKGLLYYDSTLNRFRFRENNGAADAWCREASYPAAGLSINGLTALTRLVNGNDYYIAYDASVPGNKKVLVNDVSGVQVLSRGYNGSANSNNSFLTTGKDLTSYDYTFGVGDLEEGDVIEVFGAAALLGTTAGTKSLTLAVGTGTATTLFSSTTVTQFFQWLFHVFILIRSTTQCSVEGRMMGAVQGNVFSETRLISSAQTISDISANSQLIRLRGTDTGVNNQTVMSDYHIRHHRHGGNYVRVV